MRIVLGNMINKLLFIVLLSNFIIAENKSKIYQESLISKLDIFDKKENNNVKIWKKFKKLVRYMGINK